MKYRPVPPFLQIRQFILAIETYGPLGAVIDFFQRLFNSIQNRGFGGTLRRISPKNRANHQNLVPWRPHPFDLLHGTDTGGYVSGALFSAVSLSSLHTTAYLGISPTALAQALSSLDVRYEEFTFVDIGCGKGRALLVAADFPFIHLVGVEIVEELCDIARANVATNPKWAAQISISNQDATKVVLPDGPLLLYLFHPFLAPVLRRFLKNLERQVSHSPRPVFLLYAFNPRFTEVIGSFPFLKELSETAFHFSPEEVAFDPFGRIQESFTLYSADFTR